MVQRKKPRFDFSGQGESPERLRRNAESVKKELSNEDAAVIKTTSVRLPQPLLTRVRKFVAEQKGMDGDYQTLSAVVEYGIEKVLDEFEEEQQ